MRLPRRPTKKGWFPCKDGAVKKIKSPQPPLLKGEIDFRIVFSLSSGAARQHAGLSPYRIKNHQMLLYKNEKERYRMA